jgi:hypothetical protein
VLFDGWDAKGEPVGRPWATPHIQVTACSEEQTDNTWRALQPMIELGELGERMIPDTGKTRVNLPGGGLIEPVTASARSRLGQRVTFIVQDQSESWLRSNHGLALADNQRRGLAKMGGRFLETGNAPDPVEGSVATRTPTEPGVYIDDPDGGPGSVHDKRKRRKVLKKVYGDAITDRGGWVDLDRIDEEIEALLVHDPAQAERWFLNRKVAQAGAAFDIEAWKKLRKPGWRPPRGSVITLGVDGARFRDAVAVVAVDVLTGFVWPVIIIERPDDADDNYEHDLDRVEKTVSDLVDSDRYIVWRAYCDDQHIRHVVDVWQNKFGVKRFVTWHTNRDRQMAWATRRFQEAISAAVKRLERDEKPGERTVGGMQNRDDLHHDGNPTLAAHIANARKRVTTEQDDQGKLMPVITKVSISSELKIDGASAGILAWEARNDALASGAVSLTETPAMAEEKPPPVYRANYAPPITAPVGAWSGGMSDME